LDCFFRAALPPSSRGDFVDWLPRRTQKNAIALSCILSPPSVCPFHLMTVPIAALSCFGVLQCKGSIRIALKTRTPVCATSPTVHPTVPCNRRLIRAPLCYTESIRDTDALKVFYPSQLFCRPFALSVPVVIAPLSPFGLRDETFAPSATGRLQTFTFVHRVAHQCGDDSLHVP